MPTTAFSGSFTMRPLARLGHAAVERDGAFREVDPVPGQPGDFSGAQSGEQGKDGVRQEQAVLVLSR